MEKSDSILAFKKTCSLCLPLHFLTVQSSPLGKQNWALMDPPHWQGHRQQGSRRAHTSRLDITTPARHHAGLRSVSGEMLSFPGSPLSDLCT